MIFGSPMRAVPEAIDVARCAVHIVGSNLRVAPLPKQPPFCDVLRRFAMHRETVHGGLRLHNTGVYFDGHANIVVFGKKKAALPASAWLPSGQPNPIPTF